MSKTSRGLLSLLALVIAATIGGWSASGYQQAQTVQSLKSRGVLIEYGESNLPDWVARFLAFRFGHDCAYGVVSVSMFDWVFEAAEPNLANLHALTKIELIGYSSDEKLRQIQTQYPGVEVINQPLAINHPSAWEVQIEASGC